MEKIEIPSYTWHHITVGSRNFPSSAAVPKLFFHGAL